MLRLLRWFHANNEFVEKQKNMEKKFGTVAFCDGAS